MNIDEVLAFFPQAVAIVEGNLSDTIEIRCPECSAWNYWGDWIANWIDLPENEWGPDAKHIRMECPNCNQIWDHRTFIESNWVVRNITPIDYKDVALKISLD